MNPFNVNTNRKMQINAGNGRFGTTSQVSRPNDWNPNNNAAEVIGYGGWGAPSGAGPYSGGGGAGGSYAIARNMNAVFPVTITYNTRTSFGGWVFVDQGQSASNVNPGMAYVAAYAPVGFNGGHGGAGATWAASGGGGGGAAGPSGGGWSGGFSQSGVANNGTIYNTWNNQYWNPIDTSFPPVWFGMFGGQGWPSPGMWPGVYGPVAQGGGPTQWYSTPTSGPLCYGGGGGGSGMTSGGTVYTDGWGQGGDAVVVISWRPTQLHTRTTIMM